MKDNNIEELKKKLSEIHDKEPSFMEESEKMYIESIDNTISNINSIGRLQEKVDEIKKERIFHTINVDDSSKTVLSYSLTRNFDSYSQKLLSKTFVAEAETIFLEEVRNLAKYFNATIIKKGGKK